jgi:hypothetical protein
MAVVMMKTMLAYIGLSISDWSKIRKPMLSQIGANRSWPYVGPLSKNSHYWLQVEKDNMIGLRWLQDPPSANFCHLHPPRLRKSKQILGDEKKDGTESAFCS